MTQEEYFEEYLLNHDEDLEEQLMLQEIEEVIDELFVWRANNFANPQEGSDLYDKL